MLFVTIYTCRGRVWDQTSGDCFQREICIDSVHWGVILVSLIWSREVSTIQWSLCRVNYGERFGTAAICPHCGGFRNTGSLFSEVPMYRTEHVPLHTCACKNNWFCCHQCTIIIYAQAAHRWWRRGRGKLNFFRFSVAIHSNLSMSPFSFVEQK